eukprot:4837906-Alexandrium_andersonii.AAC.1
MPLADPLKVTNLSQQNGHIVCGEGSESKARLASNRTARVGRPAGYQSAHQQRNLATGKRDNDRLLPVRILGPREEPVSRSGRPR